VRDQFLALGEITAQSQYQIFTGIGTVKAVYVEPGDRVEADQDLFELESSNLRNTLNATESQLRTVRDNLRIQLTDLQATYQSNLTLYQAGAISKSVLDRSALQVEQTQKQYNDAVSAYGNQVRNIRADLEDRTVTSPIEGLVAQVLIQEDQDVQNTLAIELVSDDLSVTTWLTANQLKRVSLGGKVIVYLDGDRDKAIEGQVHLMNQSPNGTTGLYEVEIQLGETAEAPYLGEYAEVDFIVEERQAVTIPKRALRLVGNEAIVFVADQGLAKAYTLETGIGQGDLVEVRSGLEPGQVVIVRGQQYLKSGDPVEIVD